MKDIILFCAGGFAGMLFIVVLQLVQEFLAISEPMPKEDDIAELRDNHEVSLIVGDTDYE